MSSSDNRDLTDEEMIFDGMVECDANDPDKSMSSTQNGDRKFLKRKPEIICDIAEVSYVNVQPESEYFTYDDSRTDHVVFDGSFESTHTPISFKDMMAFLEEHGEYNDNSSLKDYDKEIDEKLVFDWDEFAKHPNIINWEKHKKITFYVPPSGCHAIFGYNKDYHTIYFHESNVAELLFQEIKHDSSIRQEYGMTYFRNNTVVGEWSMDAYHIDNIEISLRYKSDLKRIQTETRKLKSVTLEYDEIEEAFEWLIENDRTSPHEGYMWMQDFKTNEENGKLAYGSSATFVFNDDELYTEFLLRRRTEPVD